jgi:hypothetical protein
VAGALPCIEVREKRAKGFASMAHTPQQATVQTPQALERANPQRNINKKHTKASNFFGILKISENNVT